MQNIIERLNSIDRIVLENDFSQNDFIKESLKYTTERTYLFNKVEEYFSKQWFIYLYELNAFDFNTIPKAKEEITEDGKINHWFYGWDASLVIKKMAIYNIEIKEQYLNKILLTLIDNYIDYVDHYEKDDKRNTRPDWFFCDYILLLPLKDITNRHFSFIINFGLRQSLGNVSHDLTSGFFNRIVAEQNQEKLLELLDIIYLPASETKGLLFDIKPKLDSFVLREFVNNSAEKLFNLLGIDIIYWLTERITLLTIKYSSSFSKFNIVSIEDDSQNWHSEGVNHLIVKHLRNCLNVKAISSEMLKEVTAKLLKSDTPILRRIAINTIRQNYKLLESLYWGFQTSLNDYECKLENHKLIQEHCSNFDKNKIDLIKSWIEAIEIEVVEGHNVEQTNRYMAYKKLEWYLALENINRQYSNDVLDRIDELKKIAGTEPSHPGYDSWSETRIGGDYSLKRLSEQNIETIPDRLNNEEKWEGYDQWGMQEDFRSLIVNRSDEVIDKIEIFFSIKFNFLYYFFDAFRTILSTKKNLNWNKVFEFTKRILLERKELWDFTGNESNDKSTSIGMLAWLIRDGVNSNNPIFTSNEHQDLLIDILTLIDERYTMEFHYLNKENERNFDIINSTRGKLYEAMLSISLLLAKSKSSSEERWDIRIKEIFDKRLKDKSYYDEFYWTVGMYTPQINYLAKKWWLDNRELIYIDNAEIDDYSFKGYLLYSPQLYRDVFGPLKLYYEKAIDKFLDEGVYADRLIQHFIIALAIDEEGAQEFLDKVFVTNSLSYLKYMVDYIDGRYIKLSPEKLLYLWPKIIEICKTSSEKFAANIIFGTADFIQYFDLITDRSLELFKQSMDYYASHPRIHRLTEISLGQIKKNPKIGGEILRILTSKIEGDYSFGSDTILSGIDELYNAGHNETANEIAIHLAEQGNYYVKDIYNKYNNPVAQ